jgi:four helix bundle protein
MALVVIVYKVTITFPKSELFGLTSQIRRSAGSIPANISEGAGRVRPKEFMRFLRIASGSLAELDTHIDLAYQLNYIDEKTVNDLQQKMVEISAQISGLIKSIEYKLQSQLSQKPS